MPVKTNVNNQTEVAKIKQEIRRLEKVISTIQDECDHEYKSLGRFPFPGEKKFTARCAKCEVEKVFYCNKICHKCMGKMEIMDAEQSSPNTYRDFYKCTCCGNNYDEEDSV